MNAKKRPLLLILSLLILSFATANAAHAQAEPEKIFIDPFTWTQEVLVSPDATAGKHELAVRIRLQVCDYKACIQGQYLPFRVPVIVEGTTLPPSPETKTKLKESLEAFKKEKAAPKDPSPESASALKLKEIIDISVAAGPDDPFSTVYRRGIPDTEVLKVQPGQKLYVTIYAKPKTGYYTYPLSDKSVGPKIRIGDASTFIPISPIVEQPAPLPYGEAKKELARRTGVTKGKTPTPALAGKNDVNPNDLMGLLIAACLGGFLMLLTPCVFPMIPITVNFFLKQSEKEHHRPLFLASIYSGTIIFLLTLTMLLFGKVVVDLANNPIFNVVLGGVLIFFALSLFGMYEIELPHFLARFTSAREGQGGVIGAFFMALTFTITSFTCTGPFIGIFLTPVAVQQPPFINLVLAALVYSATFAGPFFFLALFPTLLRKMPKSGGWLNSVKVTMGFVEIAAALKFLSIADYTLFPGRPRIFTFDAVLCAWIALALSTGFYLIGLFRLPHDDPQDHIGVARMMFATIFIGLSMYMLPLLFGIRPTGAVGEGIIAFLPPRLDEQSLALGGNGGREKLTWHKDYVSAWKEAKKEGKLIFIDFTGVNCQNCRDNEQNVFPRPEVRDALKNYVLVKLYCDSVPDPTLTGTEAQELAAKYASWRDNLSDATLPTYVVFRPEGPEPLDGEMLNGSRVDRRNGSIFDVPDFVQFLREPVKTKTVASTDYHDPIAHTSAVASARSK